MIFCGVMAAQVSGKNVRRHKMEKLGDGVVVLTPFENADAPAMSEADDDAEIRKWFEFPREFTSSIAHSEQVVSQWKAERAAGTRFPFAVRSAANRELLGGCELRHEDSGAANVSYWTYPGHRRLGVATRAVRLLCRFAFNEMGLSKVQVLIDPANTASRRVAAANGFAEEDEQDGKLRLVLRA